MQNITLDDISDGPLRSIAAAIGVEALIKLIDAVGGMTIYIPIKLGRKALNKHIHNVKGSKSVNEISKELKVSNKTVYNHLANPVEHVEEVDEFFFVVP